MEQEKKEDIMNKKIRYLKISSKIFAFFGWLTIGLLLLMFSLTILRPDIRLIYRGNISISLVDILVSCGFILLSRVIDVVVYIFEELRLTI